MARDLRFQYPGAVYHIINRGNHRGTIFPSDDDFQLFLNLLSEVSRRMNWTCHAYCLMTTHYHLLIEIPDGILSQGMGWLNGVYTQKINRKYGLSGHLFQGRFKSELVDGNMQFLLTARYIVRNPLKAKIVEELSQWPWSSYHATIGEGRAPDFLHVDDVLGHLSQDPATARMLFKEFVHLELNEGDDGIIRMAQKIYQQGPLPSVENRVRPSLDLNSSLRPVPRKQRILSRPGLEELFQGCRFTNHQKRNGKIYEAFKLYGYTQTEIGSFLDLHHTTVSKIIRNT